MSSAARPGLPPGVPADRVRAVNDRPLRTGGHVLYWMTAARRSASSFALDRAVWHARSLGAGLVVLEALRAGYPWACDRFHRFVLDGMADNARAFDRPGVTYYPYVEAAPGEGAGLVAALAADAAVVVTDDYPCSFLPAMTARAAAAVPVRMEAIDGNGLAPMRAAGKAFPTAYAFRHYLQSRLARDLAAPPSADALGEGLGAAAAPSIPDHVLSRWPAATPWIDGRQPLAALPIDHGIGPTGLIGGTEAARRRLRTFVRDDLPRYPSLRNDPEHDVVSRLSPYLHFGHIAAHEVFAAVMHREGWLGHLPARGRGAREGWWGVSPEGEAFLDQLVTWRELGFNMCAHRDDYAQYDALPEWAKATLARHAKDPRSPVYAHETFAAAETHDPLWNAAQRQLRAEGRIHNYLRMLWGKKILEWSPTPQAALATMIDLNDRYALDGRDPNSYSGISWILGRYDRPWGPERPVFGTIRYMSSENTARKVHVTGYLARFSPQSTLF